MLDHARTQNLMAMPTSINNEVGRMNCLILKVPCYLLLLRHQYDCHGYITLANKRVKTLLSGNSNAEHRKCGGTTAKRYSSLHAKTFLKLLHRNSKAVTSSAGYSESYSTRDFFLPPSINSLAYSTKKKD